MPRPGERLGERRRLLDRAADDRLDDLGELRGVRRGEKYPYPTHPAYLPYVPYLPYLPLVS